MYNELPGFDEWVDQIKNYDFLRWENMPDIELYMDQVISYMERQVASFKVTQEEKIITPSMINNYIKDGIVPKTVKKKYSKEHLAILSIVCILKQILPIQDLDKLIKVLVPANNIETIYGEFCDIQQDAIESMCEEMVRNASIEGDSSREELCLLAIRLAVGANAARIASQKIIASLSSQDREKSNEEK